MKMKMWNEKKNIVSERKFGVRKNVFFRFGKLIFFFELYWMINTTSVTEL